MQDIVAEVPAAKDLFSQASDILGYDLLNLCTEGEKFWNLMCCIVMLRHKGEEYSCKLIPSLATGPKDKLNSTVISQPAIYVASLAALEKLRQDEGDVRTGLNAYH